MRINDHILECVLFLAIRTHDGKYSIIGTGFSLSKPAPDAQPQFSHDGVGTMLMLSYVVTAKHVIEGAKRTGTQHVYIRLNKVGGGVEYVQYDIDHWKVHPTADVALIATPDVGRRDHLTWPIGQCFTEAEATARDIGPGSSVSIVGLFRHHAGQERNSPIVRTGNIAAMPAEPVMTAMGPMDAILVEARSMGGLSGSPVFVNSGQMHVDSAGGFLTSRRPYMLLLGLMHGHYDDKGEPGSDRERVNVGIGIVVPITQLLTFLDTPELKAAEDKIFQEGLQVAK